MQECWKLGVNGVRGFELDCGIFWVLPGLASTASDLWCPNDTMGSQRCAAGCLTCRHISQQPASMCAGRQEEVFSHKCSTARVMFI